MRNILNFLTRPKTKYVAIPLAILILFGLAFAFQPVRVRVGERTVCRYGEVVSDKTKLITIPRLFAGFYQAKTNRITCAKHRTCERLYEDASRAIARGDLKTAGAILGTIKKRDPDFKTINKKIDEVNKELVAAGLDPIDTSSGSSTGSPSSGADNSGSSGSLNSGEQGGESGGGNQSGGDTPPADGGDGTPTYTYLLDLLPLDISGYNLYDENWADLDASRVYVPKESSEIALLTLQVEVTGNADSAEAYMKKEVKSYYTGNKDGNLQVNGRKCYFGTHVTKFAILAWSRGGIVYIVEMYAKDNPASLKDDLVEIAKKVS